jgi:2-iminobutanoate/2-iminopropanoate deaminase
MIAKESTKMNSKKKIETADAPAAIGPYSQAISYGRMLYVSGQLPIDLKTGEMPNGIEAQTRQSLANLTAILKAAGSGAEAVLKTTVFLKDLNDFGGMNSVYGELFGSNAPARSTIEVARLPRDALVEIECVAVTGDA